MYKIQISLIYTGTLFFESPGNKFSCTFKKYFDYVYSCITTKVYYKPILPYILSQINLIFWPLIKKILS